MNSLTDIHAYRINLVLGIKGRRWGMTGVDARRERTCPPSLCRDEVNEVQVNAAFQSSTIWESGGVGRSVS